MKKRTFFALIAIGMGGIVYADDLTARHAPPANLIRIGGCETPGTSAISTWMWR